MVAAGMLHPRHTIHRHIRVSSSCLCIVDVLTASLLLQAQREVQTVTIVVFQTATRHIRARYVYEVTLPDDLDAPEDEPAVDQAPAAQLAALDEQLRAHVTRLMTVAGHDAAHMADTHAATPHSPAANMPHQDECSFDIVVDTCGVSSTEQWMPADGRERWQLDDPVATPIKDADRFNTAASISARVEVPTSSTPLRQVH